MFLNEGVRIFRLLVMGLALLLLATAVFPCEEAGVLRAENDRTGTGIGSKPDLKHHVRMLGKPIKVDPGKCCRR